MMSQKEAKRVQVMELLAAGKIAQHSCHGNIQSYRIPYTDLALDAYS